MSFHTLSKTKPEANSIMKATETWLEYTNNLATNSDQFVIFPLSISQKDCIKKTNVGCASIAIVADLYFRCIPMPILMSDVDEMMTEIMNIGTSIWVFRIEEMVMHKILDKMFQGDDSIIVEPIGEKTNETWKTIKELCSIVLDNPASSANSYLDGGCMTCEDILNGFPYKIQDNTNTSLLCKHMNSVPLYMFEKLELCTRKIREVSLLKDLFGHWNIRVFQIIVDHLQSYDSMIQRIHSDINNINLLNQLVAKINGNVLMKCLIDFDNKYSSLKKKVIEGIYSLNGRTAEELVSDQVKYKQKAMDTIPTMDYFVTQLEKKLEACGVNNTNSNEPELLYALICLVASKKLQQRFLEDVLILYDKNYTPWTVADKLISKLSAEDFAAKIALAKSQLPPGMELENPSYGSISLCNIGTALKTIALKNKVQLDVCAELKSDTDLESSSSKIPVNDLPEYDRLKNERNMLHSGAIITTSNNATINVHCKMLDNDTPIFYVFDSHAISYKQTGILAVANTTVGLYKALEKLLNPLLIDIYTVDFIVWHSDIMNLLKKTYIEQFISTSFFSELRQRMQHDQNV